MTKPAENPAPSIRKEPFGAVAGTVVDLYTLTSPSGMVVRIMNYGGIIQEIRTPDRMRRTANITLGFSTLNDYVTQEQHLLRSDHRPLREPNRRRDLHPGRCRPPPAVERRA